MEDKIYKTSGRAKMKLIFMLVIAGMVLQRIFMGHASLLLFIGVGLVFYFIAISTVVVQADRLLLKRFLSKTKVFLYQEGIFALDEQKKFSSTVTLSKGGEDSLIYHPKEGKPVVAVSNMYGREVLEQIYQDVIERQKALGIEEITLPKPEDAEETQEEIDYRELEEIALQAGYIENESFYEQSPKVAHSSNEVSEDSSEEIENQAQEELKK